MKEQTITLLGNDAQFRKWVEGFMLPEKVLAERRDGRNYYYKKTERGEQFHRLLRNGSLIRLFNRVSGGRLR
jgi:hypothetical protein